MVIEAEYMSRDEVNDIAARGGVAVVPIGSFEQHGRHLPVGTDSLLSKAIVQESVDRAVEQGTSAVMFPPIWTGFSPHHISYGGTITVRKETLLSLLVDVCWSLIDIGFSKILFVNGHGGNKPILSLATAEIGTNQYQTDVGEVSYMSLAEEIMTDVRQGSNGSAYHAGEFETSLMLYLYTELVEMETATDGPVSCLTSFSSSDMFSGGVLGMRRTYAELSDTGVRGEPSIATADLGEILFDEICDQLTNLLKEFAQLDRERVE